MSDPQPTRDALGRPTVTIDGVELPIQRAGDSLHVWAAEKLPSGAILEWRCKRCDLRRRLAAFDVLADV